MKVILTQICDIIDKLSDSYLIETISGEMLCNLNDVCTIENYILKNICEIRVGKIFYVVNLNKSYTKEWQTLIVEGMITEIGYKETFFCFYEKNKMIQGKFDSESPIIFNTASAAMLNHIKHLRERKFPANLDELEIEVLKSI